MKKIQELNKLPLTFKYIEFIDLKKVFSGKGKMLFIQCEKYQTDFYIRERPKKALIRML
jgi:hypothetical protein